MDDCYKVATEFGLTEGMREVEFTGTLSDEQKRLLEKVAYWSAWRAARNAAHALLDKAEEMKLTQAQFVSLAEVAEEWAYD